MIPKISRLGRAAALALALAAPPALAQELVTATDGQALAAIFQQGGYRAQLERGEDGHPRIESGTDGLNFTLHFIGCGDGPACRAVQFHASFRLNTPLTPDVVNDWNRTRSIGQAYLSPEGQPRLAFFVPIEGGISRAAFDYAFRSWRSALSAFAGHIGFR